MNDCTAASMGTDSEFDMEVAYFRNAVESLGVSTEEVDDSTCLRFLKARSMHVNKAAKMFQILQDYYPDICTREICVLSDDLAREVLLSVVDVGTLPSDYGGEAELTFIQDVDVPNFPHQVASVPA
ncbi:hypothetical protein KP509_33G057900 [Ceratopteris richardii]|uniref:CRAL/TRIO N-terminal domain-containing protein n=1 Tax=Ceratopteris richardii TaxID=49495 RepID=A0A8T2QQ29_CERRI|nr:hypothetical protein KP509_33G057900 [Ceratopteris richardii]